MTKADWKFVEKHFQATRTLLIIALMLIFFAQLVLGARHLSLTIDEPSYIANGYAILTTGDYWTVPPHVHPPLVNLWSAWPLLLQPERPDPRAVPGWGRDFVQFLYALWPLLGPVERQAFVTRLPIMLLAVVLMALVYNGPAICLDHAEGCWRFS